MSHLSLLNSITFFIILFNVRSVLKLNLLIFNLNLLPNLFVRLKCDKKIKRTEVAEQLLYK
jgi:hypothetical protein